VLASFKLKRARYKTAAYKVTIANWPFAGGATARDQVRAIQPRSRLSIITCHSLLIPLFLTFPFLTRGVQSGVTLLYNHYVPCRLLPNTHS
jgi:hypothetical protein